MNTLISYTVLLFATTNAVKLPWRIPVTLPDGQNTAFVVNADNEGATLNDMYSFVAEQAQSGERPIEISFRMRNTVDVLEPSDETLVSQMVRIRGTRWKASYKEAEPRVSSSTQSDERIQLELSTNSELAGMLITKFGDTTYTWDGSDVTVTVDVLGAYGDNLQQYGYGHVVAISPEGPFKPRGKIFLTTYHQSIYVHESSPIRATEAVFFRINKDGVRFVSARDVETSDFDAVSLDAAPGKHIADKLDKGLIATVNDFLGKKIALKTTIMNKRRRQTTSNTGVADLGTDYDQVYLARWAHEIIKQHENTVVKQAEDPPTAEEIVFQVAAALVQRVLESGLRLASVTGKRPYDEATGSDTDSNAEEPVPETPPLAHTGSDSDPKSCESSTDSDDDSVAKRLKTAEIAAFFASTPQSAPATSPTRASTATKRGGASKITSLRDVGGHGHGPSGANTFTQGGFGNFPSLGGSRSVSPDGPEGPTNIFSQQLTRQTSFGSGGQSLGAAMTPQQKRAAMLARYS